MTASAGDTGVDPVDRLLDLFLYAPIGLAAKGAESFPELAARGRNQAANARVLGQFALGSTNAKARKSLEEAERHLAAFLRIVADSASPSGRSATSATDAASSSAGSAPASAIDDVIAGYDDLTAAQIMPLLSSLDASQLSIVEDHERENRARKTVLGRLRQLRR